MSNASNTPSAGGAQPPGVASVALPANYTPPRGVIMHLSRRGQVPAYTLDDVRLFFLANPSMGGRVVPSTTVTLTTLEFLTREQVEVALRGIKLAEVPPGTIVCYLEFRGTFDISGVGRPPAGDGKYHPWFGTDRVHNTQLVLDPVTGRALVWGFFPDSSMPAYNP